MEINTIYVGLVLKRKMSVYKTKNIIKPMKGLIISKDFGSSVTFNNAMQLTALTVLFYGISIFSRLFHAEFCRTIDT